MNKYYNLPIEINYENYEDVVSILKKGDLYFTKGKNLFNKLTEWFQSFESNDKSVDHVGIVSTNIEEKIEIWECNFDRGSWIYLWLNYYLNFDIAKQNNSIEKKEDIKEHFKQLLDKGNKVYVSFQKNYDIIERMEKFQHLIYNYYSPELSNIKYEVSLKDLLLYFSNPLQILINKIFKKWKGEEFDYFEKVSTKDHMVCSEYVLRILDSLKIKTNLIPQHSTPIEIWNSIKQ